MQIVIVDDHTFMRELIARALSRQSSRYKVLAEVGIAAEAIQVCGELAPDLLILDIHLPGKSGIEAVPEIREASPKTKILLCTAFASEDRLSEAIHVGADGFVEKTNSWGEFLDAVDRVSSGERYFRSSLPALPKKIGDDRGASRASGNGVLSPREREILTLIAQGSTSKEVARQLYISVQTVDTHRANLMMKLGLRNVAGLVLFAVQNGLIQLPAGNRGVSTAAK